MKKVLSLITLLLLTIILGACSSEESSSSKNDDTSKKDESSDPVELNLWGGHPELDPWYNKMAEQYNAEHPNVKVTISSFPLRDYEKKIAAALPAQSAAEILAVNPVVAQRYIEGGMMVEAPDKLAKLVNNESSIPKIISETANNNGKVYGVPQYISKAALFYNTKIFEEAGLSGPPTTMEQYVEYAQKTAKVDASGKLIRAGQSLRLSGGGSGVAEKFWVMLMQNGGSIVKKVADGKYEANYDNKAGLKTVQMYVDMVHKYKTDDPTLKHDAEGFQLEQAAFFARESWVVGDTQKKAPNLEYSSAPMPNSTLVVPFNLHVTKAAEGKVADAAWDFISYVSQPENQVEMMRMTGWQPTRQDLDLKELFKEFPQYEAFFVERDLQTYPPIPEFDEIMTKFADRLANKGFTDPSFVDNPEKIEAFLEEAAKETNDILKQNSHYAK
ncbi:extracellular solute-binding protein [Neobacillus niacini]|uniref:extracellular solute-binding protein n=1 Tax=Neobacillus niacini TaxID=86668 RepID=UPI002FFFB0BA